METFLETLSPPDQFDARPAVDSLLTLAREKGASDLHLRPSEDGVHVLLRLDGVLQFQFLIPQEAYPRLLVGMKNAARLASYKKAVPQDGRLTHRDTEMRVATVPTHFGEKVVIRLVSQVGHVPALDKLGFTDTEREVLESMASQPQGLILATGPAGSGKTTTLLSTLRWLVGRHQSQYRSVLNVVTLEDPVECVLPELTQTSVAPELGMSFASGLKSLLRQDPEVILVGEIRDSETASAVTQCSLTGHLVFSTLHTRDSVGVIPRMLEMGVEPYQLAAGLAGVVYQRLLRKVCRTCRGEGCEDCNRTGYRGRTAVPELLRPDDQFRQLILEKAPLPVLTDKARELGTVPLREAARARISAGITTAEEMARVVP